MPPISLRRREFLGGLAVSALAADLPRATIRSAGETFLRRMAEREILRGLARLQPPSTPAFDLRVEPAPDAESYSIRAEPGRLILTGASERALLYAVFDFLERQGAFFGIDGDSYPLEAPRALVLPPLEHPWTARPRFAVRGLLPWPDFLNCISVYNEEDFRAYFEAMLRMRFNTFGMHVYTGAAQWAESYLSFDYAGAGHLAYLDNSASNRWGYLPERTSRYGMGAAQLYAGEVFGSESTIAARDPWEAAERARKLLRDAFTHAGRLGIRTGIGFEPYQIPDEIWRALPPEVKPAKLPDRNATEQRFDPESRTARDLLEARLAELLEAYPQVDYVWLWEDEASTHASRRNNIALSVTPFRQAHDFLRRHAPSKRLVLGGWGRVVRHFPELHQRLPGDVIFSCLNDMVGWDPVDEAFGKLEGRERWPIPWLEDDPGMWLPQFHVHRFQRDMNRAAELRCQGLLGIHWRHRIVDATAGYQSRSSWDPALQPADYYAAYARTQAAPARAPRLAALLTGTDRDHKLLSTFGGTKDGHAVNHGFTPDYGEGFPFWSKYAPDAAVVDSQQQVAAALRALTAEAASPVERERLAYLTGHVAFLVPYTESWMLAQKLQGVLDRAAEAKKSGGPAAAAQIVRAEGVPVWLELAPQVRAAVLEFQRIVATRPDLGTLASMHNKFVRLALVRLRLSMREYLGELPPETEAALVAAIRPDAAAPPRIFIPTRPTLLARGERIDISVVATGEASAVALHTRAPGGNWISHTARLAGRRTWRAQLGPYDPSARLIEYYCSAGNLNSEHYWITLV